ncbi:mechanosensitive ion channel family protein [Pedobacter insulae]|uniref:Small-conductance mechanosensitive channel n=1 Tax=Pedobacter insulae TaxID=414048 RepID=A0A1I2XJM3_9SPHI|nr:mechanosensitive ion channel domain-containing protein [Pedobacter insulae]SFH13694.1 Small-conductance mechanosensitive channel [Pedobacter insulae]
MDVSENLFSFQPSNNFHNLIIAIAAIIFGIVLKYVLRASFKFVARLWANFQIQSILKHLSAPMGFFLPLFLLNLSLNFMYISDELAFKISRVLAVLLTINFAILLLRFTKVLQDFAYHAYDLNKEDNLRERKIRTQLQFIRKFFAVIIVLVTAAFILLSFESMRKIGAGLLTGVGIGGIIIGFAAQKSLGNLLAGFQIAFTQPIRIDDVLVVEGEWGKVEEITLTYVAVNIWDQRRLILPITYFIEKPFQNWTRVSAELLGTVFLYLDYATPISPLRDEFTRLIKAHPLWDKRASAVQVTDCKDNVIEVRFLMSAKNSGKAFDLRCDIREAMLAFVQRNYPESLVKTRIDISEKKNTNDTPTKNI